MTAESENQMKSRMTESDAILRAREGDSLGFEYLYNGHRKHVYSVCLRILKNSADAEDLTQQTFLQVFRKLGTFRGESGFSTWLHRVTINVVLMHLRRKKPTEARTEDLDSVATNTEASHELAADDASLLGAIDRLTLRRALHKLPVGYRKYFLLQSSCGGLTVLHGLPSNCFWRLRSFGRSASNSSATRKIWTPVARWGRRS
jgi:RNA polymerase sigma-70 factor (ECF subfamily)